MLLLKESCLLLSLALVAAAQKTIVYRVEYSPPGEQCEGTNLEPLNLMVPSTSTARDVMEAGAREGGAPYFFSASFSDQDGSLDYIIDTINGTTAEDSCTWAFYVRSGDNNNLEMPAIGISSYIPGNNFHVLLRYESLVSMPRFVTSYAIEYPDSSCAPSGQSAPEVIEVITSGGASTALDVMEEAVAQRGRDYQFSVNYVSVGGIFGYAIDQVNGVGKNGSCSWSVFVRAPGSSADSETELMMPVSEYAIPGDRYMLILRYSMPNQPAMSVTTPMTTTGSSAEGLKMAGYLVLLTACASTIFLSLTAH